MLEAVIIVLREVISLFRVTEGALLQWGGTIRRDSRNDEFLGDVRTLVREEQHKSRG
jgi:hypothetical protein